MRYLRKLLLWGMVAGIIFVLSFPYAAAPIYSVAPSQPFTDSAWINPYAHAPSHWIKANVHLHSRSWLGTTDGRKNSIGAIDSAYRTLDYGALALSNYQRITPLDRGWVHVPCYEHGYNFQKTHQLALGATSVVWLDCILPQTVFVKQWILDILRPTCRVLIAAHPAFGRPSYYTSDMALLSNYDCIEVFNHYRTSLAHWDSALSNGILVWGVGNDDCHDVSSTGETGVCLTLVAVPENWNADNLYQAYKYGRTIAVRTQSAQLPLGVPIQHIRDDKLIIEFDGIADSLRIIGSGGIVRYTFRACSSAEVPLSVADTYLRAEVYAGNTTYALNPIIRSNKQQHEQYRRLHEDVPLTLLYRLLWALLYANGLVILRGRIRK